MTRERKCHECGEMRTVPPPPDCNLCGLTCRLCDHEHSNSGGLERYTVSGNYDSTAGNGGGALDDGDTYTFSLCEWCLDWLFAQFKVLPEMGNNYHHEPDGSPAWSPAAVRVSTEEWREKGREAFFAEKSRRDVARGLRGKTSL